MLIRHLHIVTTFIDELNNSLKKLNPSAKLTHRQRINLSVLIVGIVVTETLCWAMFERRSLGLFKSTGLSWIFKKAKISWQLMLQASLINIVTHYNVRLGSLMLDDTGKKRAKKTSRIPGAHKIKDKASGGYINGQQLIFLVLVTDTITVPVGFRFYVPDPKLSAWRKQNKKLKDQSVAKRLRPCAPVPNYKKHPTLQMLALEMIQQFTEQFPTITIKSVLADALYGTASFMDQAAAITGKNQVVSQLRANQKVLSKNSSVSLRDYFLRSQGVETTIVIRGGKTQKVTMLAARLYVKAHKKRRFIVALKYEGETEYRYLVATNLSWHHADIAQLYSLRWLVEVFIQDWKAHGGWNKMSKQQGEEGSERGLILSLLCEHLLLLHPEQSVRLKNKQPGLPAGCLIERLKTEALIDTVKSVVNAKNPDIALNDLIYGLELVLPTRESSRHMAGRDLGNQEPKPSLIRYAKHVA